MSLLAVTSEGLGLHAIVGFVTSDGVGVVIEKVVEKLTRVLYFYLLKLYFYLLKLYG
jgi:hypothetical protein